MQKPNDFETAQVAGNIEVLPVGAYPCVIKKVEESTSNNGKEFLKISFDIAEGEHKDFYKKKFQNDTRTPEQKKWAGVWNVFVLDYNGNTSKYFKGLVTCVEASNTDFKFDFNKPELLKDKKVGIVFREEEFEGMTGEIFTSVKAFRACPYDKTEEQQIPRKKEFKKEGDSLDVLATTDSELDLPF